MGRWGFCLNRRQNFLEYQHLGRFLRKALEDLGPTFIKGGQILSNRPDLLPPGVIEELRQLQRNVKPIPFTVVRRILDESLPKPVEQVFQEIDEQPLSAASVGQVHRGRLQDGKWVAIKVRRPKLEKQIQADSALLKAFAHASRWFASTKALPIAETIDAVGAAIFDQIDFRKEAKNNRRFIDNFRDQPKIRFPQVHDALSSETVLVMEFMDNLVSVDELISSHIETEAAILGALHALFKMIFVDGFVHADLHPGNMFFQTGEEVVMLDLGLVVDLSREDRLDFAKFFAGMVTNNGDLCAQVILETALRLPPDFDRSVFAQAMVELVDLYAGKDTESFEVVGFVTELFKLQRRMRLTGTIKFMTTIVALLVFEGVAKRVVPELNFQEESKQFVLSALVGQNLTELSP